MHLPARFSALFPGVAALALCLSYGAAAQSSSSQTTPASTPQTLANGGYVATNPLAGVKYNNRFDLSLGLAYDHMKAGPTLLQGSNLGGLNFSGSMWLTRRWGLESSERAYVGTSGTGNDLGPTGGSAQNNIKGPFIKEYFFTGGPEWLGPHNQHGDITAHLLAGGVYGNFTKDLLGEGAVVAAFYNNQVAPAAIIGGTFDLNRSARWVFRITPDAVMTHYSINYAPYTSQFDVNFAISVGMEYKFSRWKR